MSGIEAKTKRGMVKGTDRQIEAEKEEQGEFGKRLKVGARRNAKDHSKFLI